MAVLKDLLTKIEYECVCGTLDKEVTDIVYDSRNVSVGSMFVCIPGAVVDGHKFAAAAVSAGAGALLVEKEMELPENTGVTVIRVEDTHYAMAFVSASFLWLSRGGDEDHRHHRYQREDHHYLSCEIHFRAGRQKGRFDRYH